MYFLTLPTQMEIIGGCFNFVTMIHAFRESSINVERNDEEKLTFKLESLAKANYFDSKNAHDAIADVEVTMQLLELLAKKNNDLFKFLLKILNLRMLKSQSINQIYLLYIIICLVLIGFIL